MRRLEQRAAAFVGVVAPLVFLASAVSAWTTGTLRPVDSGIQVAAVAFVVVGAVVVSRGESHGMGWLLVGTGLFGLVALSARQYAIHALQHSDGALPYGAVMSLVGEVAFVPFLALFTVVVLLFPTGRPPSARWRWVVWAVGAAAAVGFVAGAVALWPLRGPALVVDGPIEGPGGALDVAMGVGLIGLLFGNVAAAVSLFVRFRKSGPQERAQVKWVAFAGGVLLAAYAVGLVEMAGGPSTAFLDPIFVLAFAGIPVSIGIAILRYRLYEIDRVISRTLAYALLTGLLAVVYLLAVVGLQQVLRPVMGDSQLAVAGATLVVAGLFQPARRRIQVAVDRRFNRARYDAQRTVEDFRARLRDKLDIDELTTELVGAAEATVAPVAVQVWLRGRQPMKQ